VVVLNNFTITDNGLYQDYDYLNDVLTRTLDNQKVSNAIFSIIFVDNEEIQRINREYRGIDRVTDVISFALEDNDDMEVAGIRVLGDIYVCIPRMKEQAINYGHSEKRELSFLTVHGLLHLLGYDHQTKDEEEIMFGLQELILNGANITR
jgi:probable rRNA maturation factor